MRSHRYEIAHMPNGDYILLLRRRFDGYWEATTYWLIPGSEIDD